MKETSLDKSCLPIKNLVEIIKHIFAIVTKEFQNLRSMIINE